MPRLKEAKHALGGLDATEVSRLVGASSDIALVLDDAGTIIEVVSQRDELGARGSRDWLGRPWVQTVTVESRQKVEALLRDALAAADAARWRQVNHPVKDGDDLPVLYSTLRLAPDARGSGAGRIVAFGRDLRDIVAMQRRLVESQQAMERDYWRYREAETRYRHLFETTAEAVLIVDGATQKVLEANPAAKALCGPRRARLSGLALAALFEPTQSERLQNLVAAARSVGRQDALRAQLAGDGAEVSVSASVFRQDDAAYVLVRLAAVRADASALPPRQRGGAASAPAGESAAESMLQAYLRNSPDGLVFADPTGKVIAANRAFVALAQLSAEEQMRGQPLDRWVGRTGVELGVLVATLRQRGSVGLFVTMLRGEYGATVEVEISAAVLAMGDDTVLAFAVRDIDRRLKAEPKSGALATPRSAAELAELVGRTPLKAIVSETTDLIEQLCIQTALGMTGDNRASAALLLGLSRQSLYVKLRRYGMVSAGAEEDEA